MDAVIQFRGTIYENGYGLIAQKVMRDKGLPKQSKLIYAYMCSFASINTENGERTAFPSVSLQCDELGMNQDTYYKWRKHLVDRGFITIEKAKNEKGRFERNIYYIESVPTPKPAPEQESEPYPKNSGTVKSDTENRGTNSNSFDSNSLNTEKEDTYKDTEKADFPSKQMDNEREQLFKESLRDDIPPVTFHSLSILSESYDEMYNWFGIVLRAKNKVEKERDELLLLEGIDRELDRILVAGIRKIKKDMNIQNKENYLFTTVYNGLEKIVIEINRSSDEKPYNWLEQ